MPCEFASGPRSDGEGRARRDAFHAGEADIARDSKRRAALARAGYAVVTVTWAQVRDARELDEVARVLAKHLGKRLRISLADWMSRRFELRGAILPKGRPSQVGLSKEGVLS